MAEYAEEVEGRMWDEAREPTRIPGVNMPGLVACPCGCGEQFEGYHGEPFSAECAERIRTSASTSTGDSRG